MKTVSAQTVHTLESYGIEVTDEVLAVFTKEEEVTQLPVGTQEPLPELPAKAS